MGAKIFLALIALLVIKLVLKIRLMIVYEYENALRFRSGRLSGVLGGGSYLYSGIFTTFQSVDMRKRVVAVKGQEVLTKDAVTIKITLSAEYRVSDAKTAVMELSTPFEDALYAILQLSLREAISSFTVEEMLEKKAELGLMVLDASASRAGEIGLELLSTSIKDIMFTGELKRVFSQVAQAKQEGLALLERARGETAALRSLANSANMLRQNPALMQLRMLHSTGNTLVMGLNQPEPGAKPDQEKNQV